MNYLLVAGLLFPLLSLLTGIAALWNSWQYRRRCSPVFIPLLGPILLTCWVILGDRPAWLIPIFWLSDVGTLAFLVITPRLVREWWQMSWFTRQLMLEGTQGIESAILSLHSGGHYLLQKHWSRPPEEAGVVSLGEPGTYIECGSDYELLAHHGLCRVLHRLNGQNMFLVREQHALGVPHYYSLDGWVLKV